MPFCPSLVSTPLDQYPSLYIDVNFPEMSICTEYQSEQDLGLLFQNSQTLHSFSGPFMSTAHPVPATLTFTAAQYPDL